MDWNHQWQKGWNNGCDFTVLAATLSRVHGAKMRDFKQLINQYKLPSVFLGDGGGGRVPDGQGSIGMTFSAMMGTRSIFHMYTNPRRSPMILLQLWEIVLVFPCAWLVPPILWFRSKGVPCRYLEQGLYRRSSLQHFTDEETGGWKIHAEHTGTNRPYG
ncbi:MAG: hypothetical protein MZW92_17835 [Comamonadaceae bacterium]|nr:hypothetical protein [Comamonadaceae bacterium]